MGMQYRKRTKGKSAWFNVSASSRNGVNGSVSFKPSKNITVNSGNKIRPGRVTINFGNGFKYVFYGKRNKNPSNVPYIIFMSFLIIILLFLYYPPAFWACIEFLDKALLLIR